MGSFDNRQAKIDVVNAQEAANERLANRTPIEINPEPGLRYTTDYEGGRTPVLEGYTEPGSVGYYTRQETGGSESTAADVSYIWHPSSIDYKAPGFQDPFINVMAAEPEEVDSLYALKQSNPDAFYARAATALQDQIFGSYISNRYGQSVGAQNMLEEIKTFSPKAYYSAKIGLLGKFMGWQHGQNTFERAAGPRAEIEALVPEASEAGISIPEIEALVGSNLASASSFNQQRIATAAADGGGGFSFTKDILPGVVFVGSAALAFVTAGASLEAAAAAEGAAAAGSTGAGATTATSAGAATYTAATPGFVGPSAALVGGANIAAADLAATTYALGQAATAFGMGALKGAAMSTLMDVATGQDINLGKAGIGALTGGLGGAAGSLSSYYAAPYGALASRAAGAIGGGLAGGITQAALTGKDIGTGAMYGALSGLTSLKSIGIDSTAGRVLADAALGGARATLKGRDFMEGAITSGTGSAVSAGVGAASKFGEDVYKSATAPSYEYGIKAPTTRLDYNTDLTTMGNIPASDFTIKAPEAGYNFSGVNLGAAPNYYQPSYDISSSAAVKKISELAKSTTANAITQSILGPSSTGTKVVTTKKSTTTSPESFVSSYKSDFLTGSTDPGSVTQDPYSSKYELRRFISTKTGYSTYIPFKDNKAQSPIPPGYKQVEVVGAAKGGLLTKPSKKPKAIVQSKNALAAPKQDKLPTTRKGLAVK